MKNKRKKISDSANLKKASNKNLLIQLLNMISLLVLQMKNMVITVMKHVQFTVYQKEIENVTLN